MYKHKTLLERFFTIGASTKDFAQRSLILNIELDDKSRFSFLLAAPNPIEAKSALLYNSVFDSQIKGFITDFENIQDENDIIQLQKKLSKFTDDFLPLPIRKYLLANKDLYDYLVIEDDSIDFNIPYGILFFPEKSNGISISGFGYFLAELYTPIRAMQEKNERKESDSVSEIEKLCVLSSEDLPGSVQEETTIINYFNNIKSHLAISLQDEMHLENELKDHVCNLYHFCCHGTKNCKLATVKKGNPKYIDMDFFSLYQFPKHTTIFLNICSSNYTIYDGTNYRSISKKFINREAELVIMTEWPIDDTVAFKMGTEFYKRVIEKKEPALVAIHNIKKELTSISEKLVAITYSLKGNPNMKIAIKD